jgi:hypothetical protein
VTGTKSGQAKILKAKPLCLQTTQKALGSAFRAAPVTSQVLSFPEWLERLAAARESHARAPRTNQNLAECWSGSNCGSKTRFTSPLQLRLSRRVRMSPTGRLVCVCCVCGGCIRS